MARVLILTRAFPFVGGDGFLLSEIEHWTKRGHRVLLAPSHAPSDTTFLLPDGVDVSLALVQPHSGGRFRHLLAGVRSLLLLGRELRNMAAAGVLRRLTLRAVGVAIVRLTRLHPRLTSLMASHGPFDLCYAYWTDIEAFAATAWRQNGQIGRLVTRAHGYDLYKGRWPSGYVPLADQFVPSIDRIFAVSDDGARHLIGERDIDAPVVVARLGVVVPDRLATPSPEGSVHLVTVSRCVQVKRLDRCMAAVAEFATLYPDRQVSWTHIGDGPLREELQSEAEMHERVLSNLAVRFVGALHPRAVIDYLLENQVDLLLNTSESEGIPVSAMEAMSLGIPCVASDVGGTRELVRGGCGWLVSSTADVDELVATLAEAAVAAKDPAFRRKVRDLVVREFSAEKNYAHFVQMCESLLGEPKRPTAER